MSDPALSLGRIAARMDGSSGKLWRAALSEWADGLTDEEWEATVSSVHTERINIALHRAIDDAQRALTEAGEWGPVDADASAALTVLAEVRQQLDDAAIAIGRPFPQDSLWTVRTAPYGRKRKDAPEDE